MHILRRLHQCTRYICVWTCVTFTPVDNLVISASLNAAVENAVYRIYFPDV